jgi:predicted Zn finger-like uncharacterized protein/prepilin-type processing-associated H-X9-DG protein
MAEVNQIKCPHCGQSYGVTPEQWAQYHGQTINCTKCGQAFTVTAPAEMLGQPPAQPGFPQPPGAYPPPAGGPPIPYGGYQTQPGGPTQSNGLAVTSLITGILGFCIPLSGIVAIITGIIALTKTRDPRVGGKGMAIAGISIGGLSLLMIPLMIAMLLPNLNRAREQANRIKCASNMKQIGLEVAMYSNNDPGHAFPPDLKTLADIQNLSPGVFVCPSSNDTPASGATVGASLTPGHLSYVYVGNGLTASASPDTVVLFENPSNHLNQGMNVLFADFHVEWLSKSNVQSILNQQAAGKRPITVTTSP